MQRGKNAHRCAYRLPRRLRWARFSCTQSPWKSLLRVHVSKMSLHVYRRVSSSANTLCMLQMQPIFCVRFGIFAGCSLVSNDLIVCSTATSGLVASFTERHSTTRGRTTSIYKKIELFWASQITWFGKKRIIGADILFVYTLLFGLTALEADDFFISCESTCARGHPYKLFFYHEVFNFDVRKCFFLPPHRENLEWAPNSHRFYCTCGF